MKLFTFAALLATAAAYLQTSHLDLENNPSYSFEDYVKEYAAFG